VSAGFDREEDDTGVEVMPADRSRVTPLQRAGAVLWPSFFAASVATMVFFAFVDPTELGLITFPQVDIAREWGYTIGFFMFWGCTFSSSLFTQILLRPPAEVDGR
jgi:hypothetical protein